MLRILIIDDNPLFLDSLSNLLSLFPDVKVVGVASSGAQGMFSAAELNPDLVFVDLNLPDISGLMVAEILRQMQPKTRVLIISLQDGKEYHARAKALGLERFVCKTQLFAELQSIIGSPPATLGESK